MDFINNPHYSGIPMDPYYGQSTPQTQNPYGFSQQAPQMMYNQQMPMQQQPQQQGINGMFQQIANRPPQQDNSIPEITIGSKPLFGSALNADSKDSIIMVDRDEAPKKKKSSKTTTPAVTKESGIVKSSDTAEHVKGEVEPASTIFSYNETNNMLHETLGQIDSINRELVQEFDVVRHNRTMKNKYMILNNLSENIGAMISNRISTIKEINNCITKANDMDYKKYKDIQAAQSVMNDDKYIADVYQAFIQNPQNMAPQYQMPPIDQSILGSGIVRATVNDSSMQNNAPVDAGYLNYVANMTPEQNLMRYEGNPNIKQCVVYDASSGAKFFQMMNVATGEAIPNVPVYDQMYMEDTTLDLKTRVAKNINLNETFPIIVINDNITSQY